MTYSCYRCLYILSGNNCLGYLGGRFFLKIFFWGGEGGFLEGDFEREFLEEVFERGIFEGILEREDFLRKGFFEGIPGGGF
ncbi:hypothetical protein [Chitinophaga silvisoli]|uniref:Uncharacterized protein n=1 Tax=Chitinophaga silvisoli TaxID=2291814 RepID=A0A3E1NN03_9BACT|nr:hypothetical protein [Chitinophaga silvisoli]RFM29302.1 hypothetical protein DXN04_33165 [Chitinophaga silvisoli]